MTPGSFNTTMDPSQMRRRQALCQCVQRLTAAGRRAAVSNSIIGRVARMQRGLLRSRMVACGSGCSMIVPSQSRRRRELNKLVLEALMRAYREKLRPLEAASAFSVLNQPLSDAEFNAPPSVLLVGQYSVGLGTKAARVER